jgi:hypothetical protein
MSARPVKKVRAEFGVEYDLRDTFIVVDKLYGQYNITNDGTIRAGLMKKSFGFEERAGVDERYFHRRSIINGELEDLGFLGHDLTLMYRHEIGAAWRFAAGVSWSLDTAGVTSSSWEAGDTMSYLQNYSVQYNLNQNTMFVLAAIVKHLNYSGLTTFASSLSFAHKAKPIEPLGIESDAEITYGSRKVPKINHMYDDNGNLIIDNETWAPVPLDTVHDEFTIFGARVQERFPISLNSKTLRQIIPVVEVAAYWNDLKNSGFDAQLRVGLAFGFAKDSAFQLRNTFGTTWNGINGETDARKRYRWDTEVVVIF